MKNTLSLSALHPLWVAVVTHDEQTFRIFELFPGATLDFHKRSLKYADLIFSTSRENLLTKMEDAYSDYLMLAAQKPRDPAQIKAKIIRRAHGKG